MKISPIIFLLSLVFAGCAKDQLLSTARRLPNDSGSAEVPVAGPGQTIADLLQRIRSQLPRHWTVSFEKEPSWIVANIVVSRNKPVLLALNADIPNANPFEPPTRGKFSFAFYVVPFMPGAEYHRLDAENTRIRQEMATLYETLDKMHLPRKFDSFTASDDPSRKLIERYESLKGSLQTLPDFYYRDISLQRAWWSWAGPPYYVVIDDAVRQECARVFGKVLGELGKYEDTSGQGR